MQAEFERVFHPLGHRDKTIVQLRNRKQGRNESLESYIFDVLKLCKRLDAVMPEDEKVYHVLRGLQIHYIDRILPLQPTSDARVLEIARLVDEARERMSQE